MKVEIEDTDGRTRTIIKAPSQYGNQVYTIEVAKADWSKDSIRLEIKSGGGLQIELCLTDEVVEPLLDALYRLKFHQSAKEG